MKIKHLPILLLLLCLVSTKNFAQTESKHFILSSNFSFFSLQSGSKNVERQNNLSYHIAPNIAWYTKEQLLLGFGIQVDNNRNIRRSERTQFSPGFDFYTKSQTKQQTISPHLFIDYTGNIGTKSFWVLRSALQYNFFRSNFFSRAYNSGIIEEFQEKEKSHAYSVIISPTFRYQLFKKWGLQITTGQMSFAHTFKNNMDISNRYAFNVSMRWRNWKIGVYRNFNI